MSLFAPKRTAPSKPEYTGIELQTSTGTVPLPLIWGANRIAWNLGWQANFQSIAHEEKQGGKGGGSVTSTSYTYTADIIGVLCAGPITGVGNVWVDKGESTSTTNLGLTTFLGGASQAAWGYLTTNYPSQAVAYPRIAYLAAANYELGSGASLSNHNFEVRGFRYNTAVSVFPDAAVELIFADFLWDDVYGVSPGLSAIVDQTTLTVLSGSASMGTYCQALVIGLSPALTSQESAASTLERWCGICNTAPVWTGYSLKFIPYGDQAVTNNGVTYTPPTTSQYTLTGDDYVCGPSEEGILANVPDPSVAKNIVTINWRDRNNAYNRVPMNARDQTAVDLFGERAAPVMNADEVCDSGVAAVVVQLALQRAVYLPVTYTFTLPPVYDRLEPMDVVTLTLANAGTGFTLMPVRLTSIDETDKGDLKCVGEQFNAGVGWAANYAKQAISNTPINTLQDPGSVNAPLIFEPRSDLTDATPEIWLALSGASQYWGGCQVWISFDNITFNPIGEIKLPARSGYLSSGLALFAGANPDNAHTLKVDLTESRGSLTSAVSDVEADEDATLSYVDGELINFRTATLTGSYAYDLTKLWRAQYGTAAGAHSGGTRYVRLDDRIFKYKLPARYIGRTIYLKFPSFNVWGKSLEDIAGVTAYSYAPTGAGFYVPPYSLTAVSKILANLVDFSTAVQPGVSGYIIYGCNLGYWDDAFAIKLGSCKAPPFLHGGIDAGDSWTYKATAFSNRWAWESAKSNSATAISSTPDIVTVLAASTVTAFRCVKLRSDGAVDYPDRLVKADAKSLYGIAITGATVGVALQVQTGGRIVFPSTMGWTKGKPVYVGTSGLFTQAPQTKGSWIRQIGLATGDDRMLISLGRTIFLK